MQISQYQNNLQIDLTIYTIIPQTKNVSYPMNLILDMQFNIIFSQLQQNSQLQQLLINHINQQRICCFSEQLLHINCIQRLKQQIQFKQFKSKLE
ncbi:unnamed protein product [Paramecium pentaurelia]|uniref:Uncharacterized protein n=1 Tax=Paramecium pentaurelia TaxID=43138 RepID=A0A8S1TBU7_9CILI|nr:unnamed protein product [Paramecium pentaurelia]